MKRIVLTYCMCLATFFCLAQGSLTVVPIVGVPAVDSSTVMNELAGIVRDNAKVVLTWKKFISNVQDFVMIERSCGGRDFEVVAVLKQPDTVRLLEWTDDAPAKGRNIYRVRVTNEQSQAVYSNSVSTLIAGDISFRFYPNPVDNILIIRSESLLDIQIVDGAGKVRIGQNRIQGLQTVNVSALEKGLYFLRINNRSTGVLTQEKLLKN
jgi:type IX secretion system substrate protein